MLLHDVVNLLVERQQVLVNNCLALVVSQSHAKIIHLGLTMLRSFFEGASAGTWIPDATTDVTSRTRVWSLLCSHGIWVLWGSANSLSTSIVPRAHVVSGVDRVLRRTPTCSFSLLPLQIILTSLPLIGDVLINSGKWVR